MNYKVEGAIRKNKKYFIIGEDNLLSYYFAIKKRFYYKLIIRA